MLTFNSEKLEEGVCYFPQATGEKVVVVAYEGKAYAYENICPHLGSPLNACNDGIVAKGGKYLMCSSHGAIFETQTGRCVGGPCAGSSLKPVEFREQA